jgi:murein DD-endopeptidase MepM/ murein hydrolase activator NlpD
MFLFPPKRWDRFLNKRSISLLPKKHEDREALNLRVSNIKPRFFQRFFLDLRRLKYILVAILIMGYYPTISLPSTTPNLAVAAEQSVKISAESLPEPFVLPHPGYLSTRFSYYHPGIDIATGLGMPIHPIAKGTVTDVQFGFWGLGHFVVVTHDAGFQSTYGHMGRIFVQKGATVTTSNTLGEVGLTGHTSGPHTHLEIQKNGKYIDPQTILPAIADFPKAEYLRPVGGQVEPAEKSELRKTLKPTF